MKKMFLKIFAGNGAGWCVFLPLHYDIVQAVNELSLVRSYNAVQNFLSSIGVILLLADVGVGTRIKYCLSLFGKIPKFLELFWIT